MCDKHMVYVVVYLISDLRQHQRLISGRVSHRTKPFVSRTVSQIQDAINATCVDGDLARRRCQRHFSR